MIQLFYHFNLFNKQIFLNLPFEDVISFVRKDDLEFNGELSPLNSLQYKFHNETLIFLRLF